jgi:hypothetical protein
MSLKKIFFAFVLIFATINLASAQCKGFAKKKCTPQLKPYNNSGKINSAVLRPGDKAELMMTFNSDIDYRLMICSMDNIKVNFKVMDMDKNVFFDSDKANKNYFDFDVASTQQLFVEINCEDTESLSGIMPEGCVAILTGSKSKNK